MDNLGEVPIYDLIYDEVKKLYEERNALQVELNKLTSRWNMMVSEWYDKQSELQSNFNIAMEALEKYSEMEKFTYYTIAREALRKIRSK